MYNDTELNPGTGGDKYANDKIGDSHFQRAKIAHGAEGTATDSSPANPFPAALWQDQARSADLGEIER